MGDDDFSSIAAAWRSGAGAAQEAADVATMLVSTWSEIDAALQPVIGPGGVAAIHRRSLHLTLPAHPWLADALDNAGTDLDIGTLNAVLARQRCSDAIAAGGALLQAFSQVLTSLIGSSLTERLLSRAWENTLGASPVRKSSS